MHRPILSQSSRLYFLSTLVHRRSDPFIAIEHFPDMCRFAPVWLTMWCNHEDSILLC